MEGAIVRKFDSLRHAQQELKVDPDWLSRKIKENKSYRGCMWKFDTLPVFKFKQKQQ